MIMETSTKNQFIATIIANGASFAGGLSFGWSSPVSPQITEDADGQCDYHFCVTKNEMAWIASFLPVGSLTMGFAAGPLMSKIGRKYALLIYLIFAFMGWSSLTFGGSTLMLYAGRFLVGASFGGSCIILPCYIGEIADTVIRGKLLSFIRLTIQIGLLIGYFCGYLFDVALHNAISLIIVGFFCLLIFIIPESPRYYMFNHRKEEAERSIAWLRGKNFNPAKLIQEIIEFQETQDKTKKFIVLFTERTNRKALIIALGLNMGLQMSGINGILFYSSQVFRDANIGVDPDLAVVIMGIFALIAATTSSVFVDKIGRKILVLFSSSTMFLCTAINGIFFLIKANSPESVRHLSIIPVISLCLFVFANYAGVGSIAYIMIGEIFAQNVKDTAAGVSMTFNYIMSFSVTLMFPFLAEAYGFGVTFFIFSIFNGLALVFTIFMVPETKGKSFQEIQDVLSNRK